MSLRLAADFVPVCRCVELSTASGGEVSEIHRVALVHDLVERHQRVAQVRAPSCGTAADTRATLPHARTRSRPVPDPVLPPACHRDHDACADAYRPSASDSHRHSRGGRSRRRSSPLVSPSVPSTAASTSGPYIAACTCLSSGVVEICSVSGMSIVITSPAFQSCSRVT